MNRELLQRGHDCSQCRTPQACKSEQMCLSTLYRGQFPTAAPAPVVPSFDRTTALVLLQAASKSGDPGAIGLAAQLAGAAPCKDCGYVNFKCRCQSAAPVVPPQHIIGYVSPREIEPGPKHGRTVDVYREQMAGWVPVYAAPVVPLTDDMVKAEFVSRGDNEGQGLHPYWKDAFREGFKFARSQLSAAPVVPPKPLAAVNRYCAAGMCLPKDKHGAGCTAHGIGGEG